MNNLKDAFEESANSGHLEENKKGGRITLDLINLAKKYGA